MATETQLAALRDNRNVFTATNQPSNPGRKKGTVLRSTVFREWLTTSTARANPVTGELQTLSVYDHCALAIIKRALDGDVKAWVEIQDTMHGKIAQVLPIEQVAPLDMSRLSIDELVQWQALIEKATPDPNSHIEQAEIVG